MNGQLVALCFLVVFSYAFGLDTANNKKRDFGYTTFKCENGDEIYSEFVCDGDDDCGDGSDEDCDDKECNPRAVIPCGNHICKPLSYRCDNDEDCANGVDEEGCPAVMVFSCADGEETYDLGERCDTVDNCEDGSDEANCSEYTCDPVMQMECDDGTCRVKFAQCDGIKNCPYGEDEVDCNRFE